MKTIRQLLSAAVLTIVISGVAVAGDMWGAGVVNPPPPPPPGGGRAAASPPTVDDATLDALTETVIILRKSMLSLF